MPHDAFFKAAFEHPDHAGAMVRHMLPSLDAAAIDWGTLKSDPTSFVDRELKRNYTDLLFSVRIAGAPGYIYFLLEHQSTTDPDMPYRMLHYLMRIWTRHRAAQQSHCGKPTLPVILAIVITNAPGGWSGPLSFHDQCEPHPASIPGLEHLVPQFRLLLLDLSSASNDEIKSWALAAFPKAALFALRDSRDHRKLLQDFDHWAAFVAVASQAPAGIDAVRQLMQYIARARSPWCDPARRLAPGFSSRARSRNEAVSGYCELSATTPSAKRPSEAARRITPRAPGPDLNIEDFRAKIRQHLPQTESELMTIYEQALQKGRQQGHEEGRQQGREEGRQASLHQLLTLKFGELPPEYATRLQAARAGELDRYLERFLTADSLAAIFGG